MQWHVLCGAVAVAAADEFSRDARQSFTVLIECIKPLKVEGLRLAGPLLSSKELPLGLVVRSTDGKSKLLIYY